jgi:hypothetical protein
MFDYLFANPPKRIVEQRDEALQRASAQLAGAAATGDAAHHA